MFRKLWITPVWIVTALLIVTACNDDNSLKQITVENESDLVGAWVGVEDHSGGIVIDAPHQCPPINAHQC